MSAIHYKDKDGIWRPIRTISGKSAYESAVDGGFIGTEEEFNVLLNSISNKADKSVDTEVTLTTSRWSDKLQMVSVESVTANNKIFVAPSDRTSTEIWGKYKVMCVTQSDGALTFSCAETPTDNIRITVVISG